MVIQHNISALNSHRNMGLNTGGIAKNLEKLSSGYKINRAGDDAAGLAISEKMRGQIRGLAMAEENAAAGVNLIQTAEGGLNETHAILQRMRELAVKSSNGTYKDEDRAQITKEFEAIKAEVDRISESTHYNNINLLDGSLDMRGIAGNHTGKNIALSTYTLAAITTETVAKNAIAPGSDTDLGAETGIRFTMENGQIKAAAAANSANVRNLEFKDGTISFEVLSATAGEYVNVTLGGVDTDRLQQILESSDEGSLEVKFAATTGAASITAGGNVGKQSAGHTGALQLGLTITNAAAASDRSYGKQDVRIEKAEIAGSYKITVGDKTTVETYASLQAGIDINGLNVKAADTATAESRFQNAMEKYGSVGMKDVWMVDTLADPQAFTIDLGRATAVVGNNLTFQIGANGGADQRVDLSIRNMDSKNIGLMKGQKWADGTTTDKDYTLADSSISTITDANKAIEIIEAASNMVSGQRAELGALQNRLEHTLNNLGVSKENLTAAESNIRDVDMAKEMMEFTKNNILVQASQAMLAQANQLPQGVLQLLR